MTLWYICLQEPGKWAACDDGWAFNAMWLLDGDLWHPTASYEHERVQVSRARTCRAHSKQSFYAADHRTHTRPMTTWKKKQ